MTTTPSYGMVGYRRIWLTACLLVASSFPPPGMHLNAGDKKKADPLPPRSDVLKPDDPKDAITKSPARRFPITLLKGKRYQIDLKSKDFDSFLRLEDSSGKQVAFNDDADLATFDARIVYQVDSTGDYKVVVASRDKKTGKFTISVIEAAKQPLQTGSRFLAAKDKAITLTLKDGKASHADELTEKDPAAGKRYYKVFTVELEAGKMYRIDYKAKDAKELDCLLILEDADGMQLAVNDDAERGTLDSRIDIKIARTGTYRVIATTVGADQTGRFTLAIGPSADGKK